MSGGRAALRPPGERSGGTGPAAGRRPVRRRASGEQVHCARPETVGGSGPATGRRPAGGREPGDRAHSARPANGQAIRSGLEPTAGGETSSRRSGTLCPPGERSGAGRRAVGDPAHCARPGSGLACRERSAAGRGTRFGSRPRRARPGSRRRVQTGSVPAARVERGSGPGGRARHAPPGEYVGGPGPAVSAARRPARGSVGTAPARPRRRPGPGVGRRSS